MILCMNTSIKKILAASLIVAGFGVGIYFNRVRIKQIWINLMKEDSSQAVPYSQAKNGSVKSAEDGLPSEDSKAAPSGWPSVIANGEQAIPERYNLAVPFTSQAPFKVWDEIHKDACEEASVMMAARYIRGKPINSAVDADEEILALIEWQKENFGYWKDTDALKTAEILKRYYGFKNTGVVYDIGLNDIRKEIMVGHQVIVPAAGRLLNNPFYTPPGPLYHMLVVRGYTKDKIITNDPGTKNGENYAYANQIFYDALHDWNGGDVTRGRRAMIVVRK